MATNALNVTPIQPKKLRNDDVAIVYDECCNLSLEYIVHDYGNAVDAPTVEVTMIYANFGGREPVNVPLQCFTGDRLSELEDLARDHCQEQEFNRGLYAREFPEGEE